MQALAMLGLDTTDDPNTERSTSTETRSDDEAESSSPSVENDSMGVNHQQEDSSSGSNEDDDTIQNDCCEDWVPQTT